MKPLRIHVLAALLAMLTFAGAGAMAQVPADAQPPEPPDAATPADAPDADPAPSAEAPPPPQAVMSRRGPREAVRIGQDYALGPGETVREAVVIFGNATIAGRVDHDLVVIMGTARLLDTASVGNSFVVIGGTARVESGAAVGGDLVVVGGALEAPDDFVPGGEHVIIGTRALGAPLEALAPWINRGLLWGRPIVPDLRWIWGVVAILFLVYAALTLVFERPLRLVATTLDTKPLTAFGVGLLVLLLVGPVSMLLLISIVGAVIVPFLWVALLAVGLAGRVAATRWIGMRVVPEPASPETLVPALRSLAIGFAILCVAYVVPVLGFLVWTLLGIVGLGAATLAFAAAYRQENPPPPLPVPPVGAAPTSPPPVSPPPLRQPPVVPGATQALSPPGAEAGDGPRAADGPPPTMPVAGVSSGPSAPAAADLTAFPRASFGERVAAGVLDVLLVVIVARLLMGRVGVGNVWLLLLLAYLIGFWAWKGTSVGGLIFQLRIARADGGPLEFVHALVRGLSSLFSLAVVGLGFLWILRDPERQAWHDKIAGTYVVKVPRNFPI